MRKCRSAVVSIVVQFASLAAVSIATAGPLLEVERMLIAEAGEAGTAPTPAGADSPSTEVGILGFVACSAPTSIGGAGRCTVGVETSRPWPTALVHGSLFVKYADTTVLAAPSPGSMQVHISEPDALGLIAAGLLVIGLMRRARA